MNELERELSHALTTWRVTSLHAPHLPFATVRTRLSTLQLYKTDIAFLSTRYDRKPATGKAPTKGKRNKLFAEISPRLILWALETRALSLLPLLTLRRPGSIFYDLHVSSSYVYLREFSHAPLSKASLSCVRYCVWIVKDIDPVRNLYTQCKRSLARARAFTYIHVHTRSRYATRRVGQSRVCLYDDSVENDRSGTAKLSNEPV